MAKIKEVKVTANYAWSPAETHPVYIAAGTAAQQLDATFSSTAKLELYAIDMTDSSVVAKCEGRVETANRFQKVVWGGTYADSLHENGLIVCGTDKGGIEIYNPDKILSGAEDCLVDQTSKHTGPVGALDFNPFQKNLFASGASEREIFIWDMKNPGNPMTPGAKTQPIAPISAIAWNRQVQHILASTSAITSGPCCVVWDLRKNEPIIKVQDPSGRMQCSDVAWHPEVATQLVLASEDDHSPVVQLWDLRFATSPMKVLEKHQKGVMSVSWCPRDPDLLLSCGKDNHVFCWNPNTSPPEVVYELETNAQWCFDVQWCARNPNVVSTGSFDGRITVHSLMGGGSVIEDDAHEDKQRNAVAEAFGASSFPVERPQSNAGAQKRKAGVPLKKPPKWMRTPCGASFVFGGKLATFQHDALTEPNQHQAVKRTVTINQVVTEQELLEQSKELRNALADNTQCSAFCQKRLTEAKTEFDENIWSFLKVNFDADPRKQYLQLLGYNATELKSKFNSVIGSKATANNDLTSQIQDVSLNDSSNNSSTANDSVASNGVDVFDQIAATKEKSPPKAEAKPMQIPVTEGDLDSMISQALLIGDYEAAVDLSLHGDRMADAIVIAIAGGESLLERTQKKYFAASESKISRLLSAVVTKDWQDVVRSCELENWKEALATLLTYANPEQLVALCDELGSRLEGSAEYRAHACLCYICSGNIDRLVRCWDAAKPQKDAPDEGCKAIQDLVEKIMILFRVVELQSQGRSAASFGEASADKLAEYASLLAAQGELAPAMEILPRTSNKEVIQILQDRLFHAQGDQVAGLQPPPFPFARDGIRVGQRPEVQVLPQRRGREMYGQQVQNPYSQAATSMIQSAPQPQSYTPQPQPHAMRSQSQPSPNPYASTRPLQQRNAYTGSPAQPPTSLYNPQSVSASPSFPASVPPSSAPAAMMHVQPQPSVASPYQPYQPPAVSNGPRSQAGPTQPMQAPVQNPPSSMPGPPPMGGDVSVARKSSSGWNDPPALDPNRIPRKKKQPMQPTIKPEELNLMTPTPQARAPQHPGLAPQHPGLAPQPQPQLTGAPMSRGPMMGYPPQMPANPAQPTPDLVQQMQQIESSYNEESDFLDDDYLQQAPAPTASVPTAAPKAVPKAPIPAEHQVLQTQFDELIKRCNGQAANAQMKRKLEDCSRRLEFLYDKLRASSLSQNVVAGLHQVAQSIAARDYATGLRQHQHIVSHSNFSEISAFMPGVKTMLQIAGQLRI